MYAAGLANQSQALVRACRSEIEYLTNTNFDKYESTWSEVPHSRIFCVKAREDQPA